MRSALIVETPLQLLNAIEAAFALELGECSLVVIVSKPFPARAFRPLLPFGDWKQVDYFPLSHHFVPVPLDWLGQPVSRRLNEYLKESKQLVKRLKFDRLAAHVGEVDNLVLGNLLSAYMQHLANRIRANHVYLLDDGTDTLRVNERRKDTGSDRLPSRVDPLRRIKNRLREAFLDWDLRPRHSVTFFTSYTLDTKPQDRCVRNEYRFFRQRLNSSASRDVVFFLGQPLVEDGYLTHETYLACLAEVAERYRGRTLRYLTHRRESANKIAAIRAMGLTVESFDLPIEVHMLADLPNELCSFFSSALDNSRVIFGERLSITAFRIPKDRFMDGHDFVGDVYDYFNGHTGRAFRVVDL